MCNHPTKWDKRFMAIAGQVATWSKDPDEGVGCVVTSPDGRQVAWGFNGFLPGEDDDYSKYNKDEKNRRTLHAERNALDNAETSVAGWHLYVTKPPCFQCCLAIASKRIKMVVRPPITRDSRWWWDQLEGDALLKSRGVFVVVVDGEDVT